MCAPIKGKCYRDHSLQNISLPSSKHTPQNTPRPPTNTFPTPTIIHFTQLHIPIHPYLSSHLLHSLPHFSFIPVILHSWKQCFHHFFISIISIQFAPHALSCLSFCQVHVRLLILTRRLVSVAKAAVPLLSFPSLIDHHPRWIRHCRISSSSSLISSLVVFLSVNRILNSLISLRRRRTVLGSLLR